MVCVCFYWLLTQIEVLHHTVKEVTSCDCSIKGTVFPLLSPDHLTVLASVSHPKLLFIPAHGTIIWIIFAFPSVPLQQGIKHQMLVLFLKTRSTICLSKASLPFPFVVFFSTGSEGHPCWSDVWCFVVVLFVVCLWIISSVNDIENSYASLAPLRSD